GVLGHAAMMTTGLVMSSTAGLCGSSSGAGGATPSSRERLRKPELVFESGGNGSSRQSGVPHAGCAPAGAPATPVSTRLPPMVRSSPVIGVRAASIGYVPMPGAYGSSLGRPFTNVLASPAGRIELLSALQRA